MGAAVLGRLAAGEAAVPSAKGVVEVVFALVVISALDGGRTQQIAHGFAWLFLLSVLLGKNSPVNGIAKIVNKKG